MNPLNEAFKDGDSEKFGYTWMSRWKLGSKVSINGLYPQYTPFISTVGYPLANHLLNSRDILVRVFLLRTIFLTFQAMKIHMLPGSFKKD